MNKLTKAGFIQNEVTELAEQFQQADTNENDIMFTLMRVRDKHEDEKLRITLTCSGDVRKVTSALLNVMNDHPEIAQIILCAAHVYNENK